MKQSRRMSLLESALNIVVGFGISLGAQIVFLPLLGVAVSLGQNLSFALIMTAISIVRSYLLRRLFEALHIRRPLSPFTQAVIAERVRQVEVEGWDADHDAREHGPGELARAGAAYARRAELHLMSLDSHRQDTDSNRQNAGSYRQNAAAFCPDEWPFSLEWWKPTGFRRDLVKACALIIADGEKFDRERKRGRRHSTAGDA